MLIQVAGADAVITGIVKPVLPTQDAREVGLAHPGHPQQGDALVVPGAKGFDGQLHGNGSLAGGKWGRGTGFYAMPQGVDTGPR
jgi:hypothetical protein